MPIWKKEISLSPAAALRLKIVSAGVLFLLFIGQPSLWALQAPPLTQRVNDPAQVLSARTRLSLDHMLADLERTDSTQVMILTITSLEGDNLEDFALRVFDKWALGRKGLDNGVLLLICRNDRKIRIEVGYGLESSLTDLRAGRIIGNVIAPEFKEGRFDQGVMQGVNAIIQVVRGEYQAVDTPEGEFPLIPKCLMGIAACIILMVLLLKDNIFSMAAATSLFASFAGIILLGIETIHFLYFTGGGFMTGLILSLVQRRFKPKDRYAVYRIELGDDDGRGGGFWGGGSSSGGGSPGGGVSGGGGSSGGGGASGGW